jgi:hypothetical protein
VCAIAHNSGLPAPDTEWAARPLTKILVDSGEDAVREAWGQILERHEGDGPITGTEVRRFFAVGASHHKPGWFELLGAVGDSLTATEKLLAKVEQAVHRKPNDDFLDQADGYAERAEALAQRLRGFAR